MRGGTSVPGGTLDFNGWLQTSISQPGSATWDMLSRPSYNGFSDPVSTSIFSARGLVF